MGLLRQLWLLTWTIAAIIPAVLYNIIPIAEQGWEFAFMKFSMMTYINLMTNVAYFVMQIRRDRLGGKETKLEIFLFLLSIGFCVTVIVGYWGLYAIDPHLIEFDFTWTLLDRILNLYFHTFMITPFLLDLFTRERNMHIFSRRIGFLICVSWICGYAAW
jgi:hypothetical protein